MKFEKQYKFETWNEWNHIIYFSAEDFFTEFGYFPNILLANEYTFSQINFIAGINSSIGKNVYKEDKITGEKELLEKGEEVKVTVFKNGKNEITFCFDFELQDKEFTLIYDDEADWDDDNDNDNDEPPVKDLSKELIYA